MLRQRLAPMEAAAQEFEFVAVKHEPFEDRGTDGLEKVKEPECIIVPKLEPCDDDEQPGGLDATQEPECIIVPKLEPCDDDVQSGELDATQVDENMAPEMLPKPLAGAVTQEEVILGLAPEAWVPPRLSASEEALRDPLAFEGDLEPGAAETYFGRTRFGDCSTAPTETAIPAQVGRVSTNGELSEYCLHESSSLNNCTAAAKRRFLQRFKCSSCSSPFTSKHGLIRHVFTHIPDVAPPDHVCRVCGEVSDDAESAVSHIIGHANGRGGSSESSGMCGLLPVRRKPPKRVHGCSVCGKAFPTPQSLTIHTRIHSGERPYACEICGKAFVQLIHLLNHKVRHSGDKPYHCEVCGKLFAYLTSLSRHARLHTGEKPYRCDVCGASFSLLDKLKTHRQTHTGKESYSCDICGSLFTAPNSLKAHRRRHTDEKPFSCDVCGERFRWSATFKRHRQTHTGEKPYGCNLCERKFSELNSLKRHLRSHSSDRPYSCDLCGTTFRHPGSLATHYRVHTGEKPYACNVCGKHFADSSHAKRHLQVHRIVPEAPVS